MTLNDTRNILCEIIRILKKVNLLGQYDRFNKIKFNRGNYKCLHLLEESNLKIATWET